MSARYITACMADGSARGARMTLTLAVSVRNLGGRLACSPFEAYFLPGLVGPHREELRRVGADVIDMGEGLDRPTAKARLVQQHAANGDGDLVIIDPDVVVLGDLVADEAAGCVQGRQEATLPLGNGQWKAWLEHRSISDRALAARPVPYLSTSVLVIPHRVCDALGKAWAAEAEALTVAFAEPAGESLLPPESKAFTEQLALTCALLATGTAIRPLPEGCNFRPGHRHLELAGIGHVDGVRAVHYGAGGLAAGEFIAPTPFLPLNPDLNRVNRLTAAHLGVTYRPRGGQVTDEPGSAALRRGAASLGRRVGSSLGKLVTSLHGSGHPANGAGGR